MKEKTYILHYQAVVTATDEERADIYQRGLERHKDALETTSAPPIENKHIVYVLRETEDTTILNSVTYYSHESGDIEEKMSKRMFSVVSFYGNTESIPADVFELALSRERSEKRDAVVIADKPREASKEAR